MEITYDIMPTPDSEQRLENWNTAIGLQAVDGLKPSEKLIELAQEHIEGKSAIDEVAYQLKSYYADLSSRGIVTQERQIEADIVATNIERLLETDAFVLSSDSLKRIHSSLFNGFDEFTPGEYRTYDFTKSEWILNGDTVQYEHWEYIQEEISNLLETEKTLSLAGLSAEDKIKHFAAFLSDLWLYHGFREGNTRTIALFAIKYLHSSGYQLNNAAFEKHALYFRNAFVRNNYRNAAINVYPTDVFLMQFLGNVLLGEHNELKNRTLHIYWNDAKQDFSNHDSEGVVLSEGAVGTINGTINEIDQVILSLLRSEPALSYEDIAKKTQTSRRAVSRSIQRLKELDYIRRSGSRKTGHWVVVK